MLTVINCLIENSLACSNALNINKLFFQTYLP